MKRSSSDIKAPDSLHFGGGAHSKTVLSAVFRHFKSKFVNLQVCPVPKNLKKPAFTLAEVLITLGIIGIVAAMTIPSLMGSTKDIKFRAQYKKTLAALNQAIRLGETEYGLNFATVTEDCVNGAADDPNVTPSICALFNGTLTNVTYYHSLRGVNGYNPTGGDGIYDGTYSGYMMPNGAIVAFPQNMKECTRVYRADGSIGISGNGSSCHGFIDVNGFSGPNEESPCDVANNNTDGVYSTDLGVLTMTETCSVKGLKDIITVRFFDDRVEPGALGYSIMRSGR